MATASDREQSCQLLLDASEEVDGVQEWDGMPLQSWGDIRVEYVDSYGMRQVRGETMCHICISKDPWRKE